MQSTLTKLWERRAKGDKGFTLIELLVVVVILGVLIAIAIPLYLNYRKGANDAAAQSDLRNAISVLEQCNADNSSYPTSVDSTGATIVNCANQKIGRSSGTNFTYTPRGTYPLVVSYIMADTNTNGSVGKFYCYDSAVGGPIVPTATAKTDTCPTAAP